jgi:hypothetical protein
MLTIFSLQDCKTGVWCDSVASMKISLIGSSQHFTFAEYCGVTLSQRDFLLRDIDPAVVLIDVIIVTA